MRLNNDPVHVCMCVRVLVADRLMFNSWILWCEGFQTCEMNPPVGIRVVIESQYDMIGLSPQRAHV